MPHQGPHKYQLMEIFDSKREVFKCILPDCPHYLLDKKLALGRLTHCHWCNEIFQLDAESIRKVKPKCAACVKKNGEIRRSLKGLEASPSQQDFMETQIITELKGIKGGIK